MLRSKKCENFFEHENENHSIDLILGAKSLYKLFCILFEIEFNMLRNYLLKNLILNCIRELTNRASVLILFVFKKTIIFNFVSIIKNRMVLSLRIDIYFH